MEDIASLFETVGGSGQMAALLGVKPSAASEMKRRGSIPVKYWPQLVSGFRDRGIEGLDYDALVKIHATQAA